MNESEKSKLKILLTHWIEHNSEHAQEFTKWADKAKGLKSPGVQEDIMKAVQLINQANNFLHKASEGLKEK